MQQLTSTASTVYTTTKPLAYTPNVLSQGNTPFLRLQDSNNYQVCSNGQRNWIATTSDSNVINMFINDERKQDRHSDQQYNPTQSNVIKQNFEPAFNRPESSFNTPANHHNQEQYIAIIPQLPQNQPQMLFTLLNSQTTAHPHIQGESGLQQLFRNQIQIQQPEQSLIFTPPQPVFNVHHILPQVEPPASNFDTSTTTYVVFNDGIKLGNPQSHMNDPNQQQMSISNFNNQQMERRPTHLNQTLSVPSILTQFNQKGLQSYRQNLQEGTAKQAYPQFIILSQQQPDPALSKQTSNSSMRNLHTQEGVLKLNFTNFQTNTCLKSQIHTLQGKQAGNHPNLSQQHPILQQNNSTGFAQIVPQTNSHCIPKDVGACRDEMGVQTQNKAQDLGLESKSSYETTIIPHNSRFQTLILRDHQLQLPTESQANDIKSHSSLGFDTKSTYYDKNQNIKKISSTSISRIEQSTIQQPIGQEATSKSSSAKLIALSNTYLDQVHNQSGHSLQVYELEKREIQEPKLNYNLFAASKVTQNALDTDHRSGFSIPVKIQLSKQFRERDIQFKEDQLAYPMTSYPYKNGGTIEQYQVLINGTQQNNIVQSSSPLEIAQEPDAVPISLPQSQIIHIRTLLQLPHESDITIYDGGDLTPEIRFSTHIPSTKRFIMIKYIRPSTTRLTTAFLCKHDGCDKLFPKWHNLFDHLRIHTREKPFRCPVKGCNSVFNQTANQKKHVDTHREGLGLRLACANCGQVVQKQNLLFHYNMCTHNPRSATPATQTYYQIGMNKNEIAQRTQHLRENTPQFNIPQNQLQQ
ncbi:hypothetical protein FGO68_gene2323 [Halteria grandinella]|uniref:C2H2-type domain-containing protein n=1 Tax=Halteria grandinella TaxID=5974 RepID=A0A8J8NY77_HALGN|nr:hypothetical protein FGO68_gene2323 [Halteria grandinella]